MPRQPQEAPQQAGSEEKKKGFLDKFLGSADTGFDKTTEAIRNELNSAKTQGELANLETNIARSALEAFQRDLDETKATDEQKTAALTKFKELLTASTSELSADAIRKSPERTALNNFIGNLSNYPELNAIVQSEGKMKIAVWFENSFMGRLPDSVKSMLGGEAGIMDQVKIFIAGLLPGAAGKKMIEEIQAKAKEREAKEKGTPAPATPPATAAATAAPATAPTATQEKKERAELTPEQLAIIKPLEDAGIKIDEARVEADLNYIKSQGVNTQEALVALSTEATQGNLKEIYTALRTALQDKAGEFQYRLIDVYSFQRDARFNTPERIAAVTQAILSTPRTPAQLRELLTDAQRIEDTGKFKKEYAVA